MESDAESETVESILANALDVGGVLTDEFGRLTFSCIRAILSNLRIVPIPRLIADRSVRS